MQGFLVELDLSLKVVLELLGLVYCLLKLLVRWLDVLMLGFGR